VGDEGRDDGEERKGVWVKSCPQMAGSGPSRFTTSLLRHSLLYFSRYLSLLVLMVGLDQDAFTM
jgi:hypothetical protein